MMRYCVDMDGTLCYTDGEHYADAKPNWEAIARLNALYRDGHTIIIDTARGSGSGIDHRRLTQQQLTRWGVDYDELRVGHKVPADVYIDDRAINADDWLHG